MRFHLTQRLTAAVLVALVMAFVTRAIAAPEEKPADPPPTAADWEIPAAIVRDNGFRGEVPLNALWAARKSGSDVVSRSRVPLYVYAPRDKEVTYWREFRVPAAWKSRKLFIEIGGFSEAGVVRLDGVEIAKVSARERYVEVALPMERPSDAKGDMRIEIVTGAIGDNVVLRSYPRSSKLISETYMTTSWRQKQMNLSVTAVASEVAPDGLPLKVIARIYSDPAATKEIAVMSGTATASSGSWHVEMSDQWPSSIKPWSRTEPNMYSYTVELQDSTGATLDRILPHKFAYREVWADGKNILMNGVPIHFMGDNWGQQAGDAQFNRAAARNAKAMGLTAVYRWVSDDMIDACDEEGMIIPYFWLGMLAIPYEKVTLTTEQAGDAGGDQLTLEAGEADKLKASEARITRWIKRNREHPSIVSWSMPGPWSRVTLNSLQVGVCPDPWRYWPGNKDEDKNRARYMVATKTKKFIQSLDPHRPITAQNSPDADIEYATRYLCINLDMQEREQFFDHYAAGASTRAIWSSEHGVPFQGHQFLRKAPLQQPQGDAYPAIHLENAAREFGDEVYLQEPEALLKNWNRMRDDTHRFSPVYQRYLAENVWFVHRGWRADGVSAMCHWIARDGWKPSSAKPSVEERWGTPDESDPRQMGFSKSTATPGFPSVAKDEILPEGKQYLRAMSPLLAYIGGADLPANKDHLYYSGSVIAKTAVLLNDYDKPVAVRGEWRLRDAAGKVLRTQAIDTTIGAGQHERGVQKFTFNAPLVQKRTNLTIELELRSDTHSAEGALADQFEVTVFPPHTPLAKPANRFWILGGDDRVSSMIKSQLGAKLPGNPGELRSGDVLVIARQYLAFPDSLATLKRLGVDEAVRGGLRLVVFEQDVKTIFGLRTEDVRPRRAFSTALEHPAFEGLAASDLTYWTGASDLQPAAEPITESDRMIFPARIWQVSNDNAVATRTLIRPQVGASRALAVSGFDLQESPLLETAVAGGRMIFCQFDVSNRYGVCPAATRLVDNLLSYIAAAPVPDLARGGVQVVAGDQVKRRDHLYRAAKPIGFDACGMTAAELFFRDSIYEKNWVTKTQPAGSVAVLADSADAALPRVIRRDGKTGLYQTSLDPGQFETGWSRQKIAFLHAAMRINQGGSADVGPAVEHSGDSSTLYPHSWLEGFIHPYTAACW